MTLAHARSLCAGVAVRDLPAAPDEDAAALRRLARWMLRYAPVVAADDPDGLMLDIAGCERLFGGERAHARQIAEALQGWGLVPRLAVAPTFACAWAVARFGDKMMDWIAPGAMDRALAPLPVQALRLDAETSAALADVGIERIEHLVVLPRDELAARFGAALLHRLDEATGARHETLRPVRLIRRFEAGHAFDGPMARLDIIEAAARELLARLVRQLGAAHRGVRELTVALKRADLPPQSVSLRLTYPSREYAHLWRLLGPRLERVHLGFGVTEILLEAVETQQMQNEQAAFLREAVRETAGQAAALGELVDRLIDRLGGEAVTRVHPTESYVPERAFIHAAAREPALPSSARGGLLDRAFNPAPRPSRLLEPPEPIRVLSLVPDGPPVWLDWRGQGGAVVASIGPERIVSPWWTGRSAPPRDYYEAEDDGGRQLWVYRDSGSGNWFVHGQWV